MTDKKISQLTSIAGLTDSDLIEVSTISGSRKVSIANLKSSLGFGDMLKTTYDPSNSSSDVYSRSNHTGFQSQSTITGLVTALGNKQDSSSAFDGNYNSLTNQPDIGIPSDAPSDSKQYARVNGLWAEVSLGSTDTNIKGENSSAVPIASGTDAVAIANTATATGTEALAFGEGSLASASQAIAIGKDSEARIGGSIAIGRNASVSNTHTESVAIGDSAISVIAREIVFGKTGANALSPRFPALAGNGIGSIAVDNDGRLSFSSSAGGDPNFVGNDDPLVAPVASGSNSYSIGDDSTATESGSISFGHGADSTGTGSVALGELSQSSGTRSVTLGVSATSAFTESVAVGYLAATTKNNQIVLGRTGGSAPVIRVPSLAGNGVGFISVDDNGECTWTAVPTGGDPNFVSESTPDTAPVASGTDALSMGDNSEALGTGSISIGKNAESDGSGVAIGLDSSALFSGSVALGLGAVATEASQIVLGKTSSPQSVRIPFLAGNGVGFVSVDDDGDISWVASPAGIGTDTISGTIGASAVTTTDLMYLDSDGIIKGAIATIDNLASTGLLCFPATNLSASASGTFTVSGEIGGFTGLSVGSQYFLSETESEITATRPTTSGSIVRHIGYALTSTTIMFNPSSSYIEVV